LAAAVVILGCLVGGCAGRPAVGERPSAQSSPPAPPPSTPLPSRSSSPAPPTPIAAEETVPRTAEGCRACNGDFGVHGLGGTPRCLCRTRDAGKRCRAKDDCDGECLADAGEHEVTDPGPPARGYFLGRCSEFRTTFGCHRYLSRRRDQPGPVALDELPSEICAD
jgi:hypothetical protein